MSEKEVNGTASATRPRESAGSENQLYICGEMDKYKYQHPRRNDCAGCYHGKPHHFTGRCYSSCSGICVGEKAMCKPYDPNNSLSVPATASGVGYAGGVGSVEDQT